MNHKGELAVHKYLQEVVDGKSKMDESVIETVANDIKDALNRQFNGGKRDGFTYRMSNVGRPSCQLWWEKNHPKKAMPKPTTFIMNMMIGDIVEAIFKALLTQAGVKFDNSKQVTLNLKNNTKVTGTYDLVVDGAVDDIKSASDWSYKYKFESIDTLKNGDSFGYIGQLAGYAVASDKKLGGWWVVNKANGQFKYVKADDVNLKEEIQKIERTIEQANSKELIRCFEPEAETFRGKLTGNTVLNKNCTFCDFRQSCWETLQELPAQKSLAKEPKMVQYVSLGKENIV
jgi:CRISPR/Cas system-associated exonuclease Cas4 (RecB family)|tara:strand:- start:1426 stop:2286 length:861 start_codon:yes stop_codon:yes gene_type:complete